MMLVALCNRTYTRLFAAQILALVGTGLLTMTLGLLAVDVTGSEARTVMDTALIIHIVAFMTISPVMSTLVNRLPRTTVLVDSDTVRTTMALVLPLVTELWWIYLLIFGLQATSATFAPTFQIVIPQVLPDEDEYTAALSLSRLAYDLESLLSPALAAVLLTMTSYHNLFAGAVLSFLASIALAFWVRPPAPVSDTQSSFRDRLTHGVRIFLYAPDLQALLVLNLVVVCGTAMVLVNTAVLVKTRLGGDDPGVAWLLATYGAGLVLVTLVLFRAPRRLPDLSVMRNGATLPPMGLVLAAATVHMPPGPVHWTTLGLVWFLLGATASLITTPSPRLLRRPAETRDQPAVFATQFSLGHACYLAAYSATGWLGAWLSLPAISLLLAATAATAIATSWPLACSRIPQELFFGNANLSQMSTSPRSLPFTNRPTGAAPGHWMLAHAGKRVLRPGGLGLTRAMLGRCSLSDRDMVESTPRLGRTVKGILAAAPRSYIGVDNDATAAARVDEVVRPAGNSCRQGDTAKTGLDDACSDAVIGETMLTMQSPCGKAEIVAEVIQILRPSGIYVIHELGLAPDDIDPETGLKISEALARPIHVNTRSMTLAQWGELLTDHGLIVEWTSTAPMALLKLDRNITDEGITEVLRMARNLIIQSDLCHRVMSMRRTFTKHESPVRGVVLVTCEPL